MNRVMVVEDEQVIARDIADSLATMGYEVTGTAATAEECVQGAAEQRPDLVLMDIHLQGDVDGVEAARVLRDRFDVPVVFLTAYADDETLDRAKLTGPQGYLVKPFRKTELRSAVEVGLFRHQQERELRAREEWTANTLKAIADAVIAVDADHRVWFMNGAAEELLGCRESEVRGQPLGEVFRLLNEKTRATIEDPIRLALAQRAVVHAPPATILRAGDRELPVEDSVAPIVDQRGAVLGAVVVLRDATETRRVEQQLALADRLASLGTIAASVAHEINNPLTYITSNASFVLQELSGLKALADNPKASPGELAALRDRLAQAATLLVEVEDGARRIGTIVADLSLFSRRESESKLGDVVAAVQWALRVSHSSLKHQARVTVDLRPVPPVAGDAVRLGQIFLNLILNAAHAMSDKPFEESELFVSTEARASEVCVTVRDTGRGMTPEVLERIFDPFFTTKAVSKGTGLGLAVCRRAVRSMGGSISVTSQPERGTTFVVRVPKAQSRVMEVASVEVTRARVMIVDDDRRVLAALRRMLLPAHEVATVSSALEALRQIEAGVQYDIILCDLSMPTMGGVELHERLRAVAPELSERMLFVTGGATTGRALGRVKVHDILFKPITRAELLCAIERKLCAFRGAAPVAAAGASAQN